jgi:hypothetical protein
VTFKDLTKKATEIKHQMVILTNQDTNFFGSHEGHKREDKD